MSWRWLVLLGTISLAGGLAGALLLVRTSDESFLRLLPWLMLLAAVTFTFGNRLRNAIRPGASAATRMVEASPAALGGSEIVLVVAAQLVIAAYGGYFGGGQGIMMLAMMSLAGMNNIHEMNGLKTALGATINAMALATFIVSGALAWRPGLTMAVGAAVGGYSAAALARRIDARVIRTIVIVVGWVMTVYFFGRAQG